MQRLFLKIGIAMVQLSFFSSLSYAEFAGTRTEVEPMTWLNLPVPLFWGNLDSSILSLPPETSFADLGIDMQIVAEGNLERQPYFGDWLASKGNDFDSKINLPKISENFATATILSSQLKKKIVNNSAASTLEKFDYLHLRLKKLQGQGFDFSNFVDENTHFPQAELFSQQYLEAYTASPLKMPVFKAESAPGWWGSCDRLALGNLNPQSQGLLQKFKSGAVCEGLIINRSEIEDMVSMAHKLPPTTKTIGANRGNITEPKAITPHSLFWEEVSGERQVTPALLLKALKAHVNANGSGIVIDESSFNDHSQYSYDKIWNRPVFKYEFSQAKISLAKIQLSPWGKLRLLRQKGILNTCSASIDDKISALKNALNSLEIAFDTRLTEELRFRLDKLKIAHKLGAHEAKIYTTSLDKVDLQNAIVTNLLHTTHNELKDLNIAGCIEKEFDELSLSKFVIWFPRERSSGHAKNGQMSSRVYYAMNFGEKFDEKQATWLYQLGDTPPDLIRIPKHGNNPALVALEASLAGCTAQDQLMLPEPQELISESMRCANSGWRKNINAEPFVDQHFGTIDNQPALDCIKPEIHLTINY